MKGTRRLTNLMILSVMAEMGCLSSKSGYEWGKWNFTLVPQLTYAAK